MNPPQPTDHKTLERLAKVYDEPIRAALALGDVSTARFLQGQQKGLREYARSLRKRELAEQGLAWCSYHEEAHPVGEFGRNRNRASGVDYLCLRARRERRRGGKG